MSDDAAYFAQRALQERKLAETASDPAVVAVHLKLARRYEAVAAEADLVAQQITASTTENYLN
jgi:hypothetical protein